MAAAILVGTGAVVGVVIADRPSGGAAGSATGPSAGPLGNLAAPDSGDAASGLDTNGSRALAPGGLYRSPPPRLGPGPAARRLVS